jgi:mRNA (guanine-N7-)-methyltransferase
MSNPDMAGKKNVSSHYDAQACSAPERTALHKFHNHAKRVLLGMFAKGSQSLLDLACGRGGDIHKWSTLRIPKVLGLDISGESVLVARERHRQLGIPYEYNFEQCDVLRTTRAPMEYDMVSCMFALHYMFGSEASAHTVMRFVASNLRPGGHFVGIVCDGQQINECIKHGDFDNGVMHIKALWHGKPACFGSKYTCSIANTVVEGSEVAEFLVYESVLSKVASMYGLEAVRIVHPLFRSASSLGVFHHLKPDYVGDKANVFTECSNIFAAFAFRRVSG